MKSWIAIAAVCTFSVGSFAACPNLAGSWNCTPTSGSPYDLTIAQNDITNGEHYDITHSCQKMMGLDADGMPHTTTDTNGTMTMTGTCGADGSLHVVVAASSTDSSKKYAEDLMIVLTDANTIHTTGTIKETNSCQETDKTVDTTCVRQAIR